jgi:hypothetical protein
MTTSADRPRVQWFHGISPERERRERELLSAGCPLPARARSSWARAFPRINTSLLVVEGAGGTHGAVCIERHGSRALPGHHIVRVFRVGAALPPEVADAAIEALVDSVRKDSRALRVHLELFSTDPAVRARLGEIAEAHGFVRLPEVTSYEYTLMTELGGRDNATHLASLSQGVRQNIRALARYPVELRLIQDESHSPRMNVLMRETLARTGASHQERDYGSTIRLAVMEPGLVRLVGLYRTDGVEGGDALIAFALGLNNVDHVAYDIGASARVPDFKNVSLGYPLLWDLISWARDTGAVWFDYGGVPAHDSEGEARLGRISDFKRRFEKNMVRVSDEWGLTPHPARAAAARFVSQAVKLLQRRGKRPSSE